MLFLNATLLTHFSVPSYIGVAIIQVNLTSKSLYIPRMKAENINEYEINGISRSSILKS